MLTKREPFNMMLVNVGVRDSTYVLDGLLYHESDFRIEEHYTDTNGFTDHVFAFMHRLGFRFAARIRDLGDTKLYVPGKPINYPALTAMIGGTINEKHISNHWDEILRPATSIKQGTVTASLMLRRLGSYPSQNGLAVTVYLERTVHALRARDLPADDDMLPFLSPLGWEYINLAGDYLWLKNQKPEQGKFKPIRHSAGGWRG